MHFVHASMFDSPFKHDDDEALSLHPYQYLHQAEVELTNDIAQFQKPVLIVRGALPSMVAQFYLESNSYSGLVMIDPYVLPNVEGDGERVSSSCNKLLDSFKRCNQQIDEEGSFQRETEFTFRI
mmetsp:Transcript_17314/g.25900  ORF Transcript_17314/g.25900 Transcript_17314/m.25900 type:complete len:124 (+) Transcript_17314:311-682(+)